MRAPTEFVRVYLMVSNLPQPRNPDRNLNALRASRLGAPVMFANFWQLLLFTLCDTTAGNRVSFRTLTREQKNRRMTRWKDRHGS